jgi:hypothetical protein
VVRRRDGDKCADPACNKSGEVYRNEAGRDFDLHHIDRNTENNPEDGSNHQIMCHSCNCKHDPRGARKKPYFSNFKNLKKEYESKNKEERPWQGEEEWKRNQRNATPPTMQKNKDAEPLFRILVVEFVMKLGRVKRKALLDAVCNECTKRGCSLAQSTGSRYLDKMMSFTGELDWQEDGITGEIIIFMKKEEGGLVQ